MHLLSLASSFPKFRYSQAESLSALKESDFWTRLSPKSLRILQKVLSNDNGIRYRHFAVNSLDNAWKRDAQQLNEACIKYPSKYANSNKIPFYCISTAARTQ